MRWRRRLTGRAIVTEVDVSEATVSRILLWKAEPVRMNARSRAKSSTLHRRPQRQMR